MVLVLGMIDQYDYTYKKIASGYGHLKGKDATGTESLSYGFGTLTYYCDF